MDTFDSLAWYIVKSKPREEAKARLGLLEQRYEVFMPMCCVEKKRNGKVESVYEPLYPCYMFVGLNERQPFRPILNTRGVAYVLRSVSGDATRVRPEVLRALASRMGDAGFIDMRSPAVKWAPGQHLRITEGPMAGFIGKFLSECSKERVRVLLGFLGAERPLEFEAKALEAA